ncbi:MAG: OB-fold domain-containing protein [Actinomycetota bacterium]
MTAPVPLVDYLVLGDDPHLVAHKCTACGAQFFDHRNACAACGGQAFETARVAQTGILKTFTIVNFAMPGIPVPFVAGIIDCEGTSVRGNVINCEPHPDRITTGMKVRLATYSIGKDSDGVEAVGFGFEPA